MAGKTNLAVNVNKGNGRSRKTIATLTLSAIAVAGLAGCANPFHHSSAAAALKSPATKAAASEKATGKTTVTAKTSTGCFRQKVWNAQAADSLKALYADVGALAADERAGNEAGVRKAGRQLAADAVAAATLPLPPVDQKDWEALVAAYATAGTALKSGGAVSAVPQLQAGGSAITAFATAVAKCG